MPAPNDLIVCGLHVRSIPFRFRCHPKREPWNRSGRLSPPPPIPCVALRRSQRFPRTSRSGQSLRATRRFRFSSFLPPVCDLRCRFPSHTTAPGVPVLDNNGLRYCIGNSAKLALVLPQLLFGPLEVLNIRIRSVPSDDNALLITPRFAPEQEPTIFPMVAPQACFELPRLTRSEECPPLLHRLL